MTGPLIVHAVYPSREEVEQALEGWTEHCVIGGLEWLWEAVA